MLQARFRSFTLRLEISDFVKLLFSGKTDSWYAFYCNILISAPKRVFGLAGACADTVKRWISVCGGARPGSAVGDCFELFLTCR